MFYVIANIPYRILNVEDYLKCFAVILLEFFLRKKVVMFWCINHLTKMSKFS